MKFEFATANRIIFGNGSVRQAGTLAAEVGKHALLVVGANTERAAPLAEHLREAGVEHTIFSVAGEPDIATVTNGAARVAQAGCDMIVAFGGGSAIDAGKAIAALASNAGDPLDYLEVIGKGKPLQAAPIPFVAIPTTAGTGSEVTRNAVLASPEHRVKVSLRSPLMLPRVALIDPELTIGLPAELTASTGLDALTQLIEPYVCSRANPMTDALCVEGIKRAARSLASACAHGNNMEAREDMCVASLFGGIALANAGLGAVHGFAGPIGGMFTAPHGAICAALLPHVMDANIEELEAQNNRDGLRRFHDIAVLLTGDQKASPRDGAEWVRELTQRLQIPGLSNYGIAGEHIPMVVKQALKASSMKANPTPLNPEALGGILERAL